MLSNLLKCRASDTMLNTPVCCPGHHNLASGTSAAEDSSTEGGRVAAAEGEEEQGPAPRGRLFSAACGSGLPGAGGARTCECLCVCECVCVCVCASVFACVVLYG